VYGSVGDAFVLEDSTCAVNVIKRSSIVLFEGSGSSDGSPNRRVSDFVSDRGRRLSGSTVLPPTF
jgi:hypothetical protein